MSCTILEISLLHLFNTVAPTFGIATIIDEMKEGF